MKKSSKVVLKKQEWHAIGVSAVLGLLESKKTGLLRDDVVRRRELYGDNTFTEKPPPSLLSRLFDQLKSPLTLVLIAAFLLTVFLSEYIDATVIAFALSIAVVVGIVQEGRASRAFRILTHSQTKYATVLRNDKKHVLPVAELVTGDVIEMHDGMYVPADLRLIETKELSINESTLTGEWLSVKKSVEPVPIGTPFAERSSMAWMGTFVSNGRGRGVIVEIGDSTAVGELAGAVQDVKEVKTPLQREMSRISRIMLVIIALIVGAIFFLGMMRGEPFQEMILISIAIAVAAVPEGLPAAVTIILAVGMERLLKRGGLVRNLLAAETLGSTSVILTDKTGTLTEAKMEITEIIHFEHRTKNFDKDEDSELTREVLNISLCASDAFIDEGENVGGEEVHIVGDPLERAVFFSAQEEGLTPVGNSYRAKRIDYLSFTSNRRLAAGLTRQDNNNLLCINGAPEYLLAASDKVLTQGGIKRMSPVVRKFFEEELAAHAEKGERLVAVVYKETKFKDISEDDDEGLLEDVVFAGLLVFHDPVRSGVLQAIKKIKQAGARVILVTGDNPKTALTIAKVAGIADKKTKKVVLGDDIIEMDDIKLIKIIKKTSVFARVLPNEKMRIVMILQNCGEVVAMTGDGINDAPALQRADIGIAIGSGTEVAKEASDLVLINDTLETMVAAIEEGRRIVGNLRKIVGYLLTTSLSEVVLIGTALAIGAPIPILPAQILWANIVEEGLMSVAFAFEPGEKNAMKRKAGNIKAKGVLSKDMLYFIGLVLSIASALLIGLYFLLLSFDMTLAELRSAMFLAVAVDSLFIAFSFRSLTVPLWKIDLRSNKFFLISFFINLGLLALVLTVPYFRYILSYEPLPMIYIMLLMLYGVLMLAAIEVGKWLFFGRLNKT